MKRATAEMYSQTITAKFQKYQNPQYVSFLYISRYTLSMKTFIRMIINKIRATVTSGEVGEEELGTSTL